MSVARKNDETDGFEGFNANASKSVQQGTAGVNGKPPSSSPPTAFGFMKNSNIKNNTSTNNANNNNNNNIAAKKLLQSDESDDDDDSVNEMLNLRDSILIPSNRGDKDNRLPDWSFIDADLLVGAMKKKKSAKWTTAEATVKLEASAALLSEGIAAVGIEGEGEGEGQGQGVGEVQAKGEEVVETGESAVESEEKNKNNDKQVTEE